MPKAKTVDDIDFEMDEDGELNLSGFDDDDEFNFDVDEDDEENQEEDDGEEEEDPEEEEDVEEDEESDGDVESLRNEISDIKKSLPNIVAQSVATTLAALGLTGKGKGRNDDDDDDDDEEEEGEISTKTLLKRLEKKIDTSVESAVNGKMSKYQAAMDEAEITRQFRAGATKHGAPYVKAMPQLARIMVEAELRGEDAAEKAWKIYRRLNPQQRDKLRVDAQKKQKSIAKKRPDADSDDVVTKAPERTPFKKFKGSDTEVFDKSFDSSIVSHMKKRRS